ncbi:hypothetical protein K458DRAFT_407909 [Lentithecium fluviatile CBS 122367]|uniref:Mid2 domain-containing protein n=1 Tax=Lentithecium fluviatile CBS 122367 TaxID=1168545 RepID=A0A6G1IPA1_9PLEO|nr:hypothetical protein K458DRAFT_407909 [Lentithecium fluviatile CBS 122367]
MSLIPRDTSPSCYALSGAKSPFSDDTVQYTPCNHTALSDDQHSPCCAPGDLCLSNGLCKYNNPDPTTAPFNEYWRIGCTDPTYQDPACPKQCADVGGKNPGEARLVFQCPGSGKWCCGTGRPKDYPARGTVNTTCCDEVGLYFLEDEQAIVYTTAAKVVLTSGSETSTASGSTKTQATTDVSASSSSTFQISTVTLEPSATSSPTSTSSIAPATSNSSSSNGVAYGVSFGLGIPLLTCLLLGLFLIRRRRRQPSISPPPAELYDHTRKTSGQHAYLVEPGSRELPVELEAKRAPAEIWTPAHPAEAWAPNERKVDQGWGGVWDGGHGQDVKVRHGGLDGWDGVDRRHAGRTEDVRWKQVHQGGRNDLLGNR